MSWVIDQIKESLDELGPTLFPRRGDATKAIHDEVERLAALYTHTSDWGFMDEYPLETPVDAECYIVVCREFRSSNPVFSSTQREFMYDQCWMVYYNDELERTLPGKSEPLGGYLNRFELVMEIEFDFAENVPQHRQDQFHRDFRKIVVARAPIKTFVFRSRSAHERLLTMSKLENQIFCFDGARETLKNPASGAGIG